RIWRRLGGAVDEPSRPHPSRGLSSAAVAKSLDTETGRKATTVGGRGAGRQNRPARGGKGPQPDMGGGLSGLQLRIPPGTRTAGCFGRAVGRDRAQESELDCGPGYPILFRQTPARLAGQVCGTSDRRPANRPPDPEMAEGGCDGARAVDRDEGRESAGGGNLAHPREPLPALRLGSLGGAQAENANARRCHHRALCRRRRAGVRATDRSPALPGRTPGTAGEVRAGTASGEDAPDLVWALRRRAPETARRREAGNL